MHVIISNTKQEKVLCPINKSPPLWRLLKPLSGTLVTYICCITYSLPLSLSEDGGRRRVSVSPSSERTDSTWYYSDCARLLICVRRCGYVIMHFCIKYLRIGSLIKLASCDECIFESESRVKCQGLALDQPLSGGNRSSAVTKCTTKQNFIYRKTRNFDLKLGKRPVSLRIQWQLDYTCSAWYSSRHENLWADCRLYKTVLGNCSCSSQNSCWSGAV